MESAAAICSAHYKALFESSGIATIRDRSLTARQCAYVLRQYQRYVQTFPRLLALGISKLEEDEARLPLVANLWDEHGEGDLTKAHRKVYAALLSQIGRSSPNLADVLNNDYQKAACDFALACEEAIAHGSAAFAMGFLGPGTEGATVDLYTVVARLLYPFELEDSDPFFSVHCQLDVEHAKLFTPAVEIILSSDEHARHDYIRGIETALDLECRFWNAVIQEAYSI